MGWRPRWLGDRPPYACGEQELAHVSPARLRDHRQISRHTVHGTGRCRTVHDPGRSRDGSGGVIEAAGSELSADIVFCRSTPRV
jgi:hypothetical protein